MYSSRIILQMSKIIFSKFVGHESLSIWELSQNHFTKTLVPTAACLLEDKMHKSSRWIIMKHVEQLILLALTDWFFKSWIYMYPWFDFCITYIYSLLIKVFLFYMMKYISISCYLKKFYEFQVFCHLKHWKVLLSRTIKSMKQFPILSHGTDILTGKLCYVFTRTCAGPGSLGALLHV